MKAIEQINKKLEKTPYFAVQGKRAIRFYKRYSCELNAGYPVSKSEVAPYL